MDFGLLRNLERLKYFKSINKLRYYIKEINVSDEDILKTIKLTFKEYNYLIDPHTATAIYAYNNLNLKNNSIIAVSIVHSIKFNNLLDKLNLSDKILLSKERSKIFSKEYKEKLIKKKILKNWYKKKELKRVPF